MLCLEKCAASIINATYPGHYVWVDKQIKKQAPSSAIKTLQQKMQEAIPHRGRPNCIVCRRRRWDIEGVLRRREIAKTIFPQK
jgi:hypothetical protein